MDSISPAQDGQVSLSVVVAEVVGTEAGVDARVLWHCPDDRQFGEVGVAALRHDGRCRLDPTVVLIADRYGLVGDFASLKGLRVDLLQPLYFWRMRGADGTLQ